jgi:pyruvate ferredoxin oxidoreductase gamma subunit
MREIIWYGRGGGGAFTAARLLGIAASFENRYALAFPTFGPERRGALVLGFTKLDNKKILDRSEISAADFAIVLDETLFSNAVIERLKPNGILLINTKNISKYNSVHKNAIGLDATSLALEILKKPIVNTALLGAFSAVSNEIGLRALEKAIKEDIKAPLAEKNIELLKASYKSVIK